MSDITKSILEKEIKQNLESFSEHNDADIVVSKIKLEVTSIIKKTIQTANSTTSIDERLQSLVSGLQSIMTFIEDYEQQHLLESIRMKQNTKLLQEVLRKVDKKIDEEKKDLEYNRKEQE